MQPKNHELGTTRSSNRRIVHGEGRLIYVSHLASKGIYWLLNRYIVWSSETPTLKRLCKLNTCIYSLTGCIDHCNTTWSLCSPAPRPVFLCLGRLASHENTWKLQAKQDDTYFNIRLNMLTKFGLFHRVLLRVSPANQMPNTNDKNIHVPTVTHLLFHIPISTRVIWPK